MSGYPMTGVMGVLNVTPDSFSDGGRFVDTTAAVEHGRRLWQDGADIVDVGGESTRPGADPVATAIEAERVLPVVAELAAAGVPVSVDTTKAEVAASALDAGAVVVNDVSAGEVDPEMFEVVATRDAGMVLMHRRGDPTTMQDDPRYDDVVSEVADALVDRRAAAIAAGVGEHAILVDPGIGFGKTPQHNLTLLAHLDELVERVAAPVLIGTSRKSFIGQTLALPVDARDEATLATVVWAMEHGASMVRVHDAAAARRAIDLLAALGVCRPESMTGAA
ncbi:MAG: dihydropteroate synthase [Acidimicrobiia bacterium]|nr:dihydropteroate synthase [Acidimicrobiia bacterium]